LITGLKTWSINYTGDDYSDQHNEESMLC
jgi:hypothetical protein